MPQLLLVHKLVIMPYMKISLVLNIDDLTDPAGGIVPYHLPQELLVLS
jgi:hypothetical protein